MRPWLNKTKQPPPQSLPLCSGNVPRFLRYVLAFTVSSDVTGLPSVTDLEVEPFVTQLFMRGGRGTGSLSSMPVNMKDAITHRLLESRLNVEEN